MRRNQILRTAVSVAAVTALLGACSDSDADPDSKADESLSSTSPSATDATSAPAEEVALPDGVLPLPEKAAGESSVDLPEGRYRVPLGSGLAFDIDVPDPTTAHDDGLFLATDSFIVKTEVAGATYGVPRHPCTDQVVEPVGPTVDDLVQALVDLPVYEVTRPRRVELGGEEAFYLETRVPRTYDASACEGDAVQLPGNPESAVSGPPPYLGRWWVLDVDGERVAVQQNCWGCTAEDLDDTAGMLESIAFTATP